MKKILILTVPGDSHAYAVAEALRVRGAEPLVYHTADFPSRSGESVLFEGEESKVYIEAPEAVSHPAVVDTVWRRRPAYSLDLDILHPADQKFVDLECNIFRNSFLTQLHPEAFWVNPHEGAVRAGRKLLQQRAAVGVGLPTPDTLFSNDPDRIRSFIRSHGGQIVYKPFRPVYWQDEETSYIPYTSLLTEDRLPEDALLRSHPGIYQALVPKAYELRITMMGRRAYGAKLLSQDTENGRLDWRKSYADLRMEPFDVPPQVASRCFALLERLGIVFGCFDFIVTPDRQVVFLEVNEMGQFLFVELFTGLPLLDAFSEFLIQRSTEFDWRKEQVRIRYGDIQAQVEAQAASSFERHKAPLDNSLWEGGGQQGSRSPVS